MKFVLLTSDGSDLWRDRWGRIHEPIERDKKPDGYVPLDATIPSGFFQRDSAKDWELVDGVCKAVVEPIPPRPEDAPDYVPPVPWAISNADLRRGLVAGGINPDLVTAAIKAMPEGQAKWAALADWEYANYFQRDHPLIDQLAPSFGLDAAAVDNLFRAFPAYPRLG